MLVHRIKMPFMGLECVRFGSLPTRVRASVFFVQLMRQIEKYADVYTSRVSNFLRYSPFQ